jgi:hypothetical protein
MQLRHYFAIAAMAGATLFSEIALTRLFSVVEFYHGAFLAISLGLFGFAVSGVFVFLRGGSFGREQLDATLVRYALLFAIAAPASFYFYVYLGVDGALRSVGLVAPPFVGSILEYALLAVPFFASGVCISVLLLHGAREASRLYAADLIA